MECAFCHKYATRRCTRCKSTPYCGVSCQKHHYYKHVFDCPPEGGIRTADYLVKNAYDNLMPTEVAVIYEYGFHNCIDCDDKTNLLGLYIGLIKNLGCSAAKIHSWWGKGKLPFYIKKTYDDAGAKSGYYSWFLENQHVLQGLHKFEVEKSSEPLGGPVHQMLKPYLSEEDRRVPLGSLPEPTRGITLLYSVILLGYIPRIEEPSWIHFGFCTCKDNSEEIRLSNLYRELIIRKGCKVDVFKDAYESGSVVELLLRECDSDWLLDSGIEIPGYNQPIPSVYYLKRHLLGEDSDLERSVIVDYGFANCLTDGDLRQLTGIYKRLIETPGVDPRDLHKACIAGNLFQYVSTIVPNHGLRSGLFKNPYPLQDF